MASEGNTIRCLICGNAAIMDKAARLVPVLDSVAPESVRKWYAVQTRHLSKYLSEGMEPIFEQVSVLLTSETDGGGATISGSGSLRLDTKGWHFDGELSGEQTSQFFPLETVPALPFDYENNFQIYARGSIYRFTPEDARMSAKYALLGECAHRRFSSHVQLTPGQNSGFE